LTYLAQAQAKPQLWRHLQGCFHAALLTVQCPDLPVFHQQRGLAGLLQYGLDQLGVSGIVLIEAVQPFRGQRDRLFGPLQQPGCFDGIVDRQLGQMLVQQLLQGLRVALLQRQR